MRASGTDETITLIPPLEITIERGLELMNLDEYLEITPKSVRLRKQILERIIATAIKERVIKDREGGFFCEYKF
jgi:predicted membrane GTPase involved in stress response